MWGRYRALGLEAAGTEVELEGSSVRIVARLPEWGESRTASVEPGPVRVVAADWVLKPLMLGVMVIEELRLAWECMFGRSVAASDMLWLSCDVTLSISSWLKYGPHRRERI